MIITPDVLSALKTGFRRQFQDGLEIAESAWGRVATRVPSSTRSNTYGWLGQFPTFREWVGERQIRDMAAHGYQIENKLWESTVGVKRVDVEDDNVGIYVPLFQEMGRAAAVHPDELVFGLLKRAHEEHCYDGQNFFDDEHPVYPEVDGTGDAEFVSNQDIPESDPGDSWYLLDVTRAIKPLIFQERIPPELQAMVDESDERVFMEDEFRYGVRARSNVGFGFWQMAFRSRQPLTKESYGTARAAMMNMKADGGRPLAIRPTLLVVPPNLEQAGLEVLKAERAINGATNVYRDSADLLVTPWLT
ncbi:Mu-like prophage major head subunit gpT family protein [Aquisalimonas asiatica]|uniref:Mu-like prophage major head subunit gpT n=1 Tax=Aquisalimonas asiatica TaxID=406100 RepID=A0A1H8RSV3_9GAMM|nr:Mu-like prophage major head subunit gpT family protein [Aquisalimonas asiatica]SEO69248.1 Mu-like prophage major head subunit gpT [Aquisalimonas asiatica]